MTKRVYEAAKEYGVPAKTVIKTLADHHIKAGNFTGIDANMKSILDASFKKGAKGEAQRGHKQENKQTGEGTSRKVNETSRQNKNKKQGNTPKQNNQNQDKKRQNQGNTPKQNNQNQDKKRQNQGNGQNQPNRGAKAAQGQNQGSRPQNHKGGNNGGQSSQGQQGDNKRTKYFGHSQGGNDNRSGNKNKRGGQNNRNNNKNNGGNRPHTLLSNVLNKGKHNKNKRNQKHQAPVAQEAPKKKNYPTAIELPETIIVKDFAERLGRDVGEVMKKLLMGGIMATINQELDFDTASLIADEFGVTVTKEAPPEDPTEIEEIIDPPETLKTRPPVVTIMGHVDHGKTSLLDAIRQTNVTSHEAGGITQHIGAYQVRYQGKKITFMDTPGHEAFTAMRARGAQVTDLVILVVAADDGVMEQTREAANHAKAAGVPLMVAVNKIDKPAADPERAIRELSEIGLVAEEWGGDTVFAKVSAKSGQGLDELLEMILLQAEMMELKANPDKPAKGRIVEAKLDKGRGPMATVLIQEGTLRAGDPFVCGIFSGRVRAMFDDQGRTVKEAGPSIPVEVQGFEGVPEAGEEFFAVEDEKIGRRIADERAAKQRERELVRETKVTLETFLASKPEDQEAISLNLLVKADVQGSLEAITEALNKQSTDKVRISVIHGGAGAITESDVMLASASDAIIIGFNVRPTAKVRNFAEQEKVDIRFYDIIYKLVDDIRSAMAGLLAPVVREEYLGQAEVRQVFSVPKVGSVAGSFVVDGKITRNAGIRILRDGVVIHTGKISSLKRFKDDAREVLKGYECGVGIENFNDIKEGDVFEAFESVEEAATL